jgi:hypothetical protein
MRRTKVRVSSIPPESMIFEEFDLNSFQIIVQIFIYWNVSREVRCFIHACKSCDLFSSNSNALKFTVGKFSAQQPG